LASGCSFGLSSAHKANAKHTAKNAVTCLTINADYAVVNIKAEENVENATVDYYSDKNIDVEVSETDGVLTITQKYSALIKEPKGGEINVTLPTESNVQIQLSITAGTANLSDFSASTLKANVHAGNCTLTNVTASTADLALNAGDCTLSNVTATTADLTLDAGKLTLTECELTTLRATINSGDLTGRKLSTDYARLTVNCGNTDIALLGDQEEYTLTPSIGVGNTACTEQEGTTDKYIQAEINVGNLTVTFTEKPTSAKN
jgi:DUF4097 and DUF4098 domain-containing protein YvlB